MAHSAGGVVATVNAWDNVIRSGIEPWPPPELLQKAYKSRQVRAYRGYNLTAVRSSFGFYSDLQSLHSEDALTWSVFGPVIYSDRETRRKYVQALLQLMSIETDTTGPAWVWLWRRIPHPDTLVSGGPEIDFGIQIGDVIVLGEAKWMSEVSTNQGKERDKTPACSP